MPLTRSETTSPADAGAASIPGPDLARAVVRGIQAPLAALHATLESLEHAGKSGDLGRALGELAAVERRIQVLTELIQPPAIQPLSCTLSEITRGALTALAPSCRERVWTAIEDQEATLFVDGPLLVSALAALLENATNDPRVEVLLHAHTEDEGVAFAIVDDLGSVEPPDLPRLANGHDASIETTMARSQVALLGGSLTQESATQDHHLTVLRIPRGEEQG